MDSLRLKWWKRTTKERNKSRKRGFRFSEYFRDLELLTNCLVGSIQAWRTLPKRDRTNAYRRRLIESTDLIRKKMHHNIDMLNQYAIIPVRYVNRVVKRVRQVLNLYYPHREKVDPVLAGLCTLLSSLTRESAFEISVDLLYNKAISDRRFSKSAKRGRLRS